MVLALGAALYPATMVSEAIAAESSPRSGRSPWVFSGIDGNADNMISPQEARAARDQLFIQIDIDGDGRITREEYERYDAQLASLQAAPPVSQRTGELFTEIDASRDGFLTQEETLTFARKRFQDATPAGAKGLPSSTYQTAMAGVIGTATPAASHRHDVGQAEAANDVRLAFRSMDVNGDGRIAKSEWTGAVRPDEAAAKQAADREFARLDTRKRGYLERSDFEGGAQTAELPDEPVSVWQYWTYQ